MERMSPFSRQIHPDEMWLYRNPRRESYVGTSLLWSLALLAPLLMALCRFALARDREDLLQTLLGVSLALGINCILTDMVKLMVGRPRPDFFWRCFPDGELNPELRCSGAPEDVAEGRKSFPSGHSSISFCSLGFMSWWCMGKLRVWGGRPPGPPGALLLLALAPLTVALAVALSRTCDYHHHWQDVLVGSLMGLGVSFMVYRQHFPPLSSQHPHRPLSHCPPPPPAPQTQLPLPHPPPQQVKWI